MLLRLDMSSNEKNRSSSQCGNTVMRTGLVTELILLKRKKEERESGQMVITKHIHECRRSFCEERKVEIIMF